MARPRPARRIALRWGETVADDHVLDAAEEVHANLEGRVLLLGEQVDGAPGVPLVVEDTDPRGRPVEVTEDTILELERPQEVPPGDRVEVVVLVDASYSMRKRLDDGTRYEAAVRAADALLRSLRGVAARASVAGFTHEARVLHELEPLEQVDARSLTELTPRGRSRPADAVEQALATLHHDAEPDLRRAIVLVTDGEGPLEGLVDVARRAQRLGIDLHVACVGPAEDVDALEAAVGAAGGTFQDTGPADLLEPAFRTLAATVGADADWIPPAPAEGGTEFEIILRSTRSEEDDP